MNIVIENLKSDIRTLKRRIKISQGNVILLREKINSLKEKIEDLEKEIISLLQINFRYIAVDLNKVYDYIIKCNDYLNQIKTKDVHYHFKEKAELKDKVTELIISFLKNESLPFPCAT